MTISSLLLQLRFAQQCEQPTFLHMIVCNLPPTVARTAMTKHLSNSVFPGGRVAETRKAEKNNY